MLCNALTGRCMWKHDLKDAYLEAGGIEGDEKEGGGEGSENGWTWGMQSDGRQREREREIWMVEDG